MSAYPDFISSRLVTTECIRTVQRLFHEKMISEEDLAKKCEDLRKTFEGITLIDVSKDVLDRAMDFYPVHIKTLDAIHLSSALLWKEVQDPEVIFLTHDERQGKVARILGFKVSGMS